MQAAPQPLLVRLPILPGESLFSFLVRLSHSNSYDSPRVMWDLILGKLDPRKHHDYVKDRLDFPLKTDTYNRIATLTMTDALTLYKSTHHRFVLILTPPPRSVNHMMLPDGTSVPCLSNGHEWPQMRPSNISQFCPKCLQQNPHFQLNWVPVALSACLSHECLLVDRCPQCHEQVSQHAIITAECNKCRSDLTSAEIISIANDEIGLRVQRMLHSWFMEYVTPEYEVAKLPQQSPAVLYRIIEGIQNSVEEGKCENWPYFHSLSTHSERLNLASRKGEQIFTPYESYGMYTTACKVLMNWPESFFDFLISYSNRRDYSLQNLCSEEIVRDELFKGPPQDHLGVLYTRWIKQQWIYPEFKFVQDAFDYHIANNYWLDNFSIRTNFYKKRPDLVGCAKYVSITAAAKLLNTSPNVVELLRRNKELTQVVEDGCELVDKQEVLYYYKGWDSLITPEKAGLLMGVPNRVIEDLVDLGIIYKEPGSKNNPGRYYKISEVMTCLEIFSKYVKYYSSQEIIEKGSWIDFARADHIFTYKESFKAVTILLQIMEGNLTAYHSSEDKFQLKSLLFAPQNFQECVVHLRDRSICLERYEVIKLLGIKDATLTQWIRNRRLLPTALYKHTQYFDEIKVHDLYSKCVTQEEAIRILVINIPTLRNWIRANQVPGILADDPNREGEDAHIFDKEQLIQWRNEHFTSNETVQVLGITKATLYLWVKEGKLRPLDAVNGNQYWFIKQAVLDLKS